VGREQDSGETEKERGREAEHCWKWEMAWAIHLIIGENIYGRFGRVIWNDQDAANDVFLTIRIFSLVICKRHFVWPTSRWSCIHEAIAEWWSKYFYRTGPSPLRHSLSVTQVPREMEPIVHPIHPNFLFSHPPLSNPANLFQLILRIPQ